MGSAWNLKLSPTPASLLFSFPVTIGLSLASPPLKNFKSLATLGAGAGFKVSALILFTLAWVRFIFKFDQLMTLVSNLGTSSWWLGFEVVVRFLSEILVMSGHTS